MLVLSRKFHETIMILDPVTGETMVAITVVGLDNGRVKLGFETPGEKLPIFREEVLERSHIPAKLLGR
jgi:carbon storage regulator CsrA